MLARSSKRATWQKATDKILSVDTLSIILRGFGLACIFVFAVSTSFLASFSFYQSTVPSVSLVKDIWLQYG